MLITEHRQSFTQRSRTDIIANLLSNAVSGSRKTRLIYRCNLSVAQFNKYTNYLIDSQLLERSVESIKGKKSYEVYQTTQKGIEFLSDYKRIGEAFERLESTFKLHGQTY